MIKLIVAVDQDNAIGWQDGRLPWHLPADMRRFKELTTGDVVLMGRKTFDSLGRPSGLPHRHNVVITRGSPSSLEDIVARKEPIYQTSLSTYAKSYRLIPETDKDLWIIGGAEIYRYALELKIVDQIYLTQLHINSAGDVALGFDLYDVDLFRFQQLQNGVEWTLVETEEHSTHEIPFSFLTLSRRQ